MESSGAWADFALLLLLSLSLLVEFKHTEDVEEDDEEHEECDENLDLP